MAGCACTARCPEAPETHKFMDLTTRCPHCGTTFAATFAQLQLRKGYIRCVQCSNIFDGYEAVVASTGFSQDDLSAPAPAPAPASAPASASASASARTHRPAETPRPVAPGEPVREPARVPAAAPVEPDVPDVPAHAAEPRLSFSAREPVESIVPDDQFTIRDDAADVLRRRNEPDFLIGDVSHPEAPAPEPVISARAPIRRREGVSAGDEPVSGIHVEPRRHAPGRENDLPRFMRAPHSGFDLFMRIFWGGLTALATVLLLLQLGYVYRAQLANAVPALRSPLQQLCQPLGCQVPWARQIDNIMIVSSALREAGVDGSAEAGRSVREGAASGADNAAAAPGAMMLRFSLRNTLDRPQEWPALSLSLTDFSGTLIARRTLMPRDYLDAQVLAGPFPAGNQLDVAIPLATQNLKINGYKLEPFFP